MVDSTGIVTKARLEAGELNEYKARLHTIENPVI